MHSETKSQFQRDFFDGIGKIGIFASETPSHTLNLSCQVGPHMTVFFALTVTASSFADGSKMNATGQNAINSVLQQMVLGSNTSSISEKQPHNSPTSKKRPHIMMEPQGLLIHQAAKDEHDNTGLGIFTKAKLASAKFPSAMGNSQLDHALVRHGSTTTESGITRISKTIARKNNPMAISNLLTIKKCTCKGSNGWEASSCVACIGLGNNVKKEVDYEY
jgi:hypothetical protein